MKRVVLGVLLAGLVQAAPPAFPGAEGYGATSVGGRGGVTLLVTSLADDGPGTLRAAIAHKGPRMILFRIGGLIDLAKPLVVREPFVTIAGESAPGGGICLRGYGLVIQTTDVIVRHLRVRPGDLRGEQTDAVSVASGARRVMLDHVSASWSVDETLSPSGDIADVTVQWSIISESLRKSVHAKGSHGYGTLLRATGGVTLHHNLWAHHNGRNPRFGDNYGKGARPTYDFRNNVIYNCGDYCSGLVEGRMQVNYVANTIRPGVDTSAKAPIYLGAKANGETEFYIVGNEVMGRPEQGREAGKMLETKNLPAGVMIRLAAAPFATPAVSEHTVRAAYALVLQEAGASRPVRDAVDARLLQAVSKGQGKIIDSQEEVGGWPAYAVGSPWPDGDSDGLPDDWERAHGGDPKDGRDAARVAASGYTRLEEYLHALAAGARSADAGTLTR